MYPTNQHPIYVWLSNVQEAEPVDHWPPSPSPGMAHRQPSNELTTPYRMRRRGARPDSNSRTRVRKSLIPRGSEDTKARGQDYGRKPRHKTREDRYEYKAPTSAAKCASETKRPRPKRQRRGRKHTLNEDFQAANVVHSRLTLHQVPNMGFFNKGKTSSPVNPRPALGPMMFSETHFLAQRKDHGMKPTPSVILTSSKKQKGRQAHLLQHLVESNSSTPNHSKKGEEPPLSRWWPAVNDPRLQAHDLHQQLSSDHNRYGVRILESVSSQMPRQAKQEKEKGKAIQNACPGSPYTWSDSAPHTTQGYALQEHLLNTLHHGLDFSGIRERSPLPHASREYLDLEHLKGIMEERQRNWKPSSSKGDPSARRGPMVLKKCRLSSIRSCETVSTRVFCAEQNDQTNVNPGEASGANQIDYIDSPQIRGVEGEIGDLQSPSFPRFSNPQLGPELAELILNNADEAFWRTLNMAYAMVNSEHTEQGVSRLNFGASDTLAQAQDLTRYDLPEAALLGLLDAPQTEQVATMSSGYSTLLFPNGDVEYIIEPDEVNRLHEQVPLDEGGHEEAARTPRLNRPYRPDDFATAMQMELKVVSRTPWSWRRNQLY